MRVLEDFRRAVDALENISLGLTASLRAIQQNEPSMERLQGLERSRALWEAEVEGMLAKAEGKLKAAANAEARTRTMAKAYENEIDPFDADREQGEDRLSPEDVEPRYAEEVQPLHMGMEAESKKAYALRAKFS